MVHHAALGPWRVSRRAGGRMDVLQEMVVKLIEHGIGAIKGHGKEALDTTLAAVEIGGAELEALQLLEGHGDASSGRSHFAPARRRTKAVHAVDFSPRGKVVATGGSD